VKNENKIKYHVATFTIYLKKSPNFENKIEKLFATFSFSFWFGSTFLTSFF